MLHQFNKYFTQCPSTKGNAFRFQPVCRSVKLLRLPRIVRYYSGIGASGWLDQNMPRTALSTSDVEMSDQMYNVGDILSANFLECFRMYIRYLFVDFVLGASMGMPCSWRNSLRKGCFLWTGGRYSLGMLRYHQPRPLLESILVNWYLYSKARMYLGGWRLKGYRSMFIKRSAAASLLSKR